MQEVGGRAVGIKRIR